MKEMNVYKGNECGREKWVWRRRYGEECGWMRRGE